MAQEIKEFGSLSDLLEDLEAEEIYGGRRRKIVESFLTMKAKVVRKPYNGGFELTPLCNFDCKMCYVHLSREQLHNEHRLLSAEQWKWIMAQAIEAGMLSADLTGGECLLYPEFEEIFLFLISHGVRVNVLTNGYLITDELIELWRKYKPDTIQISLYGSNEQTYKTVTGHNAFNQVITNIAKLKEAGMHIRLTITPNRYMAEDADSLMALVRSLEIEYSIGSVTLPARPETGRIMDDYMADATLFNEMRKGEEEYQKAKNATFLSKIVPYRFKVKGLKHELGLPCGSGRSGFHVNWKGEMTPCIPFNTVTHSILKLGFAEAWKQTGISASLYSPPHECISCEHYDYCSACPAEKSFGMLNGPLNVAVCTKLNLRLSSYKDI